eukprot:NODE_6223_length_521_cov_115.572961.p2 GENE.NODE_6223_length_521_cov_115.572961~~NODE_6223_length_521_cov_115.572961.p2  ORF type:complete len:66 (+),score=25.18 NODE_6223_length_521_cov_115.572961:207-404(+)
MPCSLTLKVFSDECLDCQLFLDQMAPRVQEHNFGEKTTLTWRCGKDWLLDVEDGMLKVGMVIREH